MPNNLSELRSFTGTETWWQHPLFKQFTYTDGVRYVAQEGGAYWLVEKILSLQFETKLAKEPFQVWTLAVNDDETALLTCTDGNEKELYCEKLSYTDFPIPQVKFYLTDNVLLLTSEY